MKFEFTVLKIFGGRVRCDTNFMHINFNVQTLRFPFFGRLDEALQELRLLCGVVQELETRNQELEIKLASFSCQF